MKRIRSDLYTIIIVQFYENINIIMNNNYLCQAKFYNPNNAHSEETFGESIRKCFKLT